MRTAPLAIALMVASFSACERPTTLGPEDRAASHRLDSAFVRAWLQDDTAAVLATLTPDVVLMPAGQRPLQGDSAIRAFWWPKDGSRTRITDFQYTVDEMDGTPTLAYVRGHGSLSFTYEKDTVRLQQTSRNMVLTVAAKQDDGSWRIRQRMWGTLAQ